MSSNDMGHMDYLQGIANADVQKLQEKESVYRGSWKKRGGTGAFFVLARKWDALEQILSGDDYRYDIFYGMMHDGEGDGTLIDQIQDLRRYLLLVEAEMVNKLKRGELDPIPRAHTLSDLSGISDLMFGVRDADNMAGSIHPDKPMKKYAAEPGPGTPEDGGHHARFAEEREEADLWPLIVPTGDVPLAHTFYYRDFPNVPGWSHLKSPINRAGWAKAPHGIQDHYKYGDDELIWLKEESVKRVADFSQSRSAAPADPDKRVGSASGTPRPQA